ncbi:MAG TPA: biotin/lipoyl-binding protein [Bacillota bacterium]|nr:biotin/lipoyl-binding protein [Bacillota bacterium]
MKKYKVTVDGRIFNVAVEEVTAPDSVLNRGSARRIEDFPAHPPESKTESQPPRPSADGFLNVEAPMPGSIVDIVVNIGDKVKEGDVLLILEAMKMENEITAPQAGTVREIYVTAGNTVATGDILMALS